MADLSYLFQGSPPASVTSSTTGSSNLPDWYQDYLRGIAGKATAIAGTDYQPYPDQRIADFTPDQQQAFQNIRSNQGDWQSNINSANNLASNIMPNTQNQLNMGTANANNANSAVAGPAQAWTANNNWQQYMSPYTSSVVDEIGRLGNQNLMENIIPGVQSQFIGSGQFGSTRNADILGRSIRDAQADISGKQSAALESGYGTAANIFNSDANRMQGQQQLQANTAIQAGQLNNQGGQIGAQAGAAGASQLGALGQMQQSLGSNDATSLGAIGTAQQQLDQRGLDTSYQDFLNQRDYDKNNIGFLNAAVRGMPMNTSQTQVSNTPQNSTQTSGASPYSWLGTLGGLSQYGGTTG